MVVTWIYDISSVSFGLLHNTVLSTVITISSLSVSLENRLIRDDGFRKEMG
jgi:hypothetical protein